MLYWTNERRRQWRTRRRAKRKTRWPASSWRRASAASRAARPRRSSASKRASRAVCLSRLLYVSHVLHPFRSLRADHRLDLRDCRSAPARDRRGAPGELPRAGRERARRRGQRLHGGDARAQSGPLRHDRRARRRSAQAHRARRTPALHFPTSRASTSAILSTPRFRELYPPIPPRELAPIINSNRLIIEKRAF